jgi:hypothetical protein
MNARMPRTLSAFLVPCTLLGGLALGCGSDDDAGAPSDVRAEVSENIATVVNVHWTTAEPTVGRVEYGPTSALGQTTPLERTRATVHTQALLGLAADEPYYYRVVVEDGTASSANTVRTGNLPLGIPELELEGDGHDGFVLLPILDGTRAVAVVIDPQGRIVWYHTDDRDLDFYRVRLSADGTSILYNAANVSGKPAENSELVRVALDGSSQSSIPMPLLAHDFVEHPDGTLGAMAVEYGDFDGTTLRGDKIVEVDPAGNQRTVWTSWDCFDPAETPGDDIELGWTFANALDYDPEADAYYLGLRNFSSIVKIDRQSGACEWVLGTFGATFDIAPGSAHFLHQHQFHIFGNHIVVFDNDGMPGQESRVLEYELDFENNVATQVWSYVTNPPVYTFVLGEPARLDNGDTFVDWSVAGRIERVTPAGEATWRVSSGAGFAFGFSTLAKSLYR